MILKLKWRILLLWIICLPFQNAFSQHSSNNNYTGAWETPSSWNPTWTVPQTNISGYDVTINGYITLNGPLSFSGSTSKLIINDTLVIKGDLLLSNNNNLTINDNGILIVRGNLTFGNQSNIITNGYLIITGNVNKYNSINQGSFKSNDNPVKLFIGGKISSPGITTDPSYPVLNCIAPATARFPNSTCSYGNMTDILNDPIYSFFQSTCAIATPTILSGGATTFCAGGSITLTSSTGPNYLWSTGETTASINVATSGSYTVKMTDANGCESAKSATTIVVVNANPVAVAGPDLKLQYTFETKMNAELSAYETGEWSLISGSGHISDINSPATRVTELSVGKNIFLWKVMNGSCEDTAEVKITVSELFVPSVITPNGDGKNDYFKISGFTGKIELIIINRWGNEEYTSDNYLNDWEGRNNKGKELPNDTYFYILKLEKNIIKKGSVLIKR